MAKQSKAQKEAVERVMHEWKHGELESGQGGKVRNPKQAIAIALSEAGASNRESPETNKRHLVKTKRNEAARSSREASPSKAELYQEATRKGIAGRSRMDKAALQKALQH